MFAMRTAIVEGATPSQAACPKINASELATEATTPNGVALLQLRLLQLLQFHLHQFQRNGQLRATSSSAMARTQSCTALAQLALSILGEAWE
jgi:hypothetical protein